MFQDLSLEQSLDKDIKRNPRLYEAAETLFQHHDHNNLFKICAKILADNPNDIKAIEFLYESMKAGNKLREQEICLDNLFILKQDLESLNLYSQFLFEQKRYQEALTFIQENLSMVSDRSEKDLFETYRVLGAIAMQLGDLEAAEEYYHSSYRLNSDSDLLLSNLGSLYLYQEDVKRAKEYYHQALVINQKNDKAWMGLAICHLEVKDSQLFWANIKNAIEINPKEEKYLEFAAKQAMLDCEYSYILHVMENYLFENPLNVRLGILFSSLLYQAGRKQAAYFEIKRIENLEPYNEDIRKMIDVLEENNA